MKKQLALAVMCLFGHTYAVDTLPVRLPFGSLDPLAHVDTTGTSMKNAHRWGKKRNLEVNRLEVFIREQVTRICAEHTDMGIMCYPAFGLIFMISEHKEDLSDDVISFAETSLQKFNTAVKETDLFFIELERDNFNVLFQTFTVAGEGRSVRRLNFGKREGVATPTSVAVDLHTL